MTAAGVQDSAGAQGGAGVKGGAEAEAGAGVNPLAVRVFGRTLRSPLLNASGSLGPTEAVASSVDFSGFGAMVSKTVTIRPRAGNPPPRTIETPAGLLNSIGLANPGIDAFLERDLPRLVSMDPEIPVVVSIAGDAEEEFSELARKVDSAARRLPAPGILAVEVNASCPNVASGDSWCSSLKLVGLVTRSVKAACSLPVAVKLSPNVRDVARTALAVEEAGGDAVSVANTFLGMSVDVERRRPTLANVRGGVSGPAIKPLALWHVYQVAAAVRIPVIGMGGVTSWRDALEFVMAGATLVAIGTGLIRDPRCIARCASGLRAYCAGGNAGRIFDLVGCAQQPEPGRDG